LASEGSRVTTVHYAKERAKMDNPWTIIVGGKTIAARKIVFLVRDTVTDTYKEVSQTVFRPEKEANPRAWLRVDKAKVDVQPHCLHNLRGCVHILMEHV